MKIWLLGITFSLTVTLGTYAFSIYHTMGGETRVSEAKVYGPVQNGSSVCIRDCLPGSKVEKFQSVDFGHGPIALSANRSNGEISADVGVQKEFSTPIEGASVTIAATKSLHGEDAIHFLRLPGVRSVVPDRANKYIKDYEARQAAEAAQRTALFDRLVKKAATRDTSTAVIRPNEQLIRAICTAEVNGSKGVQETPIQTILRHNQCMQKYGVSPFVSKS